MSQVRSAVEKILETNLKSMPFIAAIARTRSDLEGLIPDTAGLDIAFTEIIAEKERSEDRALKLSELSTSHKLDLSERSWYSPEMLPPAGVWAGLTKRMSRGSLAGAVQSIDRSSDSIMACVAEPLVADDRRRGLVVGNVQSGKTANYSAVIAKSFDTRCKLVVVLSGVHNNLRKQTQIRLERDLGVAEDPASWHLLTSSDADFGKSLTRNASSIVAHSTRVLAVVKKNRTRLENVLEFLRALDTQTRASSPVLIIDDESDQATPDSSPDSQNDPTTINRLMRELWAEVANGTYIGYTATPFANVFMDPNPRENELEELYPSDFIHVMPTPSEYFGAERIFGLDRTSSDEVESDGPDVVRSIPEGELINLVPRGNRQNATFVPEITPSLSDSIKWFVVASAARRIRGQGNQHSTMLVHTTHYKRPHFAMRDQINAFLAPLRQEARDGRPESFYDVFHAEMDRVAELYTGDGPAPTWPRISDEIPNVLRNLRVAVDNSEADPSERLEYQDDEPQTVIVIGGGTLSRGLTLEGLFVSFFTRSSNTYDTLLQMGRWFGYRKGYEDLQRIWVSDGLENDYRFLASVESDLRIDIERMRRSGQTPRQIGVRVRQHPGRLQITSPNKMKHVVAAVDFEGYRLQTYIFDVAEAATRNLLRTRHFLASIDSHRCSRHQEDPLGSVVYANLGIHAIADYLEAFEVHEQFREILADAIEWSSAKLPNTPWNVVLASGSMKDKFGIGDVSVRSMSRAPVRVDDSLLKHGFVNIRALMSGQDTALDLKLLGREPLTETSTSSRLTVGQQLEWRRSEKGGEGRGLLVLYPISRKSLPQDSTSRRSQIRMPMAEAIEQVDPALASAEAGPIIGIAVITPFDTKGEVDNKGKFAAVLPVFTDDEDVDEHASPDFEKDFKEDSR